MRSGFRTGLKHCLDLALPRRCLLCGDPAESTNLCQPCFGDLPWNAGACQLCGLPWLGQVGGLCPDCLAQAPVWDELRAALRYEFPALAAAMLCYAGTVRGSGLWAIAPPAELPVAAAAYCVPVPLHGWRRFRRGYNQAQELARLVARAQGSKLSVQLVRTRPTAAQTRLSAKARKANLHGAFAWRGPSLRGARIILVDDVLTTGATARECVKVLRRAGAEYVEVWVAARVSGPGFQS